MRAVAVTVTGSSHERRGTPGQDASLTLSLPGNRLIAAVADGAGSASLSGEGSRIAVTTAVAALRVMIEGGLAPDRPGAWEGSARALVEDVQRVIAEEATRLGAKPTDLATTLLLVTATPDHVAVAQIGDGAVVVAPMPESTPGSTTPTPPTQYIALTTPAHGEHLNETTFITSPGALDAMQVNFWPHAAGHLAMFTDGLQMLALTMPQALPHGPFFAPLFTFLDATADLDEVSREVRTLLQSPQVRSRSDDDISLVLASWCCGESP